MKTSLGIWAFGPMVTRFVPAGYQPQWASESTASSVRSIAARRVASSGETSPPRPKRGSRCRPVAMQ